MTDVFYGGNAVSAIREKQYFFRNRIWANRKGVDRKAGDLNFALKPTFRERTEID